MTSTLLQELSEHPEWLHRYTVEDYHRMIADGTLEEGEPYELLGGQVVRKIRSTTGEDPMTVGVEHSLVVKRLGKLSRLLEPLGCHMQTQQPVTLPPYDEPEPDGAVVRGSEEDYADRHPGRNDLLCVIEVADTSLRRDRGSKLETYANSAIGTYVIVNLVDHVAELYTEPVPGTGRYDKPIVLSANDSLALPTAGGQPLVVAVRALLP
jgi:Uma2 family endonuclease